MRYILLFLLAPLFASSQVMPNGDTIFMKQYGYLTQYAQVYVPKNWQSIPTSQRRAVFFFHGQGEKGNGATDTARIRAAGLPNRIRANNSGVPPNMFIFSPQLNSGANFWTREARNAILAFAATYGISINKRSGEGYSLGATGINNFVYDKASDWASVLSVAGAQGNQDDFVITGDSLKAVPGFIVSYMTADATQAISNGVKALDSTLANNADGPYLMETDFYFGGGHTVIDDTVWNKYGQYLRWHALHDRRYDTTVALHVDSLDRGFDDHFYRKTRRLVDSLPSGSFKTSMGARVQAAWERAYGVNAAEYGVDLSVSGKTVDRWKNLATNAANQSVSGLIDNRTGTVSTYGFTLVSTGGSTQKRGYTRNYNQYNGLPPTVYADQFEIFSKTATTTYRYTGLPAGNYYIVIDGTSETVPGSYETGLSVTVGGVTKTLHLQYYNTSRYLFFGPVSPTSGNIDVAAQGYVTGGVGHIGAMRLIKAGTYGGVNQPPYASAGPDQTKTIPTSTATMAGSASDIDGTFTVLWTKQSGPSGGAITTPTSLTTGITGLVEGVYTYRLTVTDDDGATAFDEMTITVNNTLEIDAGTSRWIPIQQGRPQLPFTQTATVVTGSASSFTWSQDFGPSTLTITNGNTATPTFSGAVTGDYRLRVTSGSASDTVRVAFRDLVNGRPKLPCRVGTKQWHIVGNVQGGGTNAVSFSKQYVKRDNGIPGLMGGDTIMLVRNPNNNGIWNRVTFGDIESEAGCPIVIVPDTTGTGIVTLSDTTVNNTGAFYLASADSNSVSNLIIDGTYNYRKKGVAYGFQIGNPGRDNTRYYYRGITGNYLNNVTIKGLALFNCSTGFSLKTISDSTKPFKVYDHYRNTIYIEDCYADSAINEIAYIGTTDPPGLGQGNDGPAPKGNYISFNRVITRGSGWDGLQTSFYEAASIKNCVVLRSGNANSAGQIFSMFHGGAVGPAIMDSNFIRFQVGGPGFLGDGKSSFRNNIIWDYQQMYNSQAVVTGFQEVYDSLQIFNENNYYFGQTGSSFGVIVTNTGGEKFKPGSFRYNTIATTKTLGQFFSTAYGDTIANNSIIAPLADPTALLDTSRLKDMPSYRMYKYIAANPGNRTPSFFDIYAPIAPPEPNQPPVANAGTDITTSSSSVVLNGTASDQDGTVTVLWTQTAGTATTITNGTTLTPTISGLTPGVRTYRLRATDDDGAVTDDFVQVTMVANQPPVISYITPDQTIRATGITLSVVATDPEGAALSFYWYSTTTVPVAPSISNPFAPTTDITGLLPGVYDFLVQVNEANNVVTVPVKITVLPAILPGTKFRVNGSYILKP